MENQYDSYPAKMRYRELGVQGMPELLNRHQAAEAEKSRQYATLSQGGQIGPKEPTLQGRAEELMNYLSRLGANQSIMREKNCSERGRKSA